jgi:endoglucanase
MVLGDMRDIPPVELVRDMGIGVNIGNTLDSIWDGPQAAGETGWGNPVITKSFITALAKHGYHTIRLPVTWAEHLGSGPGYLIEETWMDRVEEVVNWCLDEGLYVILNLHHDGGGSQESWILNAANDPDGVTKQFSAVWGQIAARFSGASDYLIFEAMNEVGFDKMPYGDAQKLLTRLNQAFVDTVRASGDNNPQRYLLVSGYWTDIDRSCDAQYQLPNDKAGKLILSVHYYTPATFCIAENPNNSWGFKGEWGSGGDYAELASKFEKLQTRFISNTVPVILGEYGVVKNQHKDEASRVKWMSEVTQTSLDHGICPVLWDTGTEISRYAPYAMSASLKAVMDTVR